jgi:hypothetical protein
MWMTAGRRRSYFLDPDAERVVEGQRAGKSLVEVCHRLRPGARRFARGLPPDASGPGARATSASCQTCGGDERADVEPRFRGTPARTHPGEDRGSISVQAAPASARTYPTGCESAIRPRAGKEAYAHTRACNGTGHSSNACDSS